MIKELVTLGTLLLITGVLWLLQLHYPSLYLQRAFISFLAVTVTYFLFKVVIEATIARRITEAKARYSFKKAVSILYMAVLVAILIRIWIEQTETLLVSYGLLAAGIAIALQDFFRNFVGGVIIFTTGIYRVGDRIELQQKYGDVIDIGIMYTTLLELKEWVAGDQATGRLTLIPNGYVLSSVINNYTKDNNFIWDELEIPLTYDSEWREALTTMRRIVGEETRAMASRAEDDILKLKEKYYLTIRTVEPEIYLTLTDNWIMFHIRFITDVRQRRQVRSTIGQLLLDEIERSEKLRLASATVDIVGFPEVRVKQQG
ncbi:MAG: mechanosensitive ion channel family protein [Methanomicrobia archaeon]|nr:mechanosensitive ion channel family protein [Methanomicrobia archaeon]